MATNRIRDSQKVIHFLRAKLDKSHLAIFQNEQQSKRQADLSYTGTSINGSSHFSTNSIKNKCDKFEQYLLDVENLERVYSVVREKLGVTRPRISVPRNERNLEFELKVTHDPVFREKMLAKQRRSSSLKPSTKRKCRSNSTNKVIIENTELKEEDSALGSSDNDVKEADTSKNVAENLDSTTLEVINARKRLGRYNLDVRRFAGRKMSYQVYAYIEKPKDVVSSELKHVESNDNILDLSQDSFAEKADEAEDKNPFVKVIISDNNPFKRREPFVPLKDEEIDLKERMTKKWNLPEWMKFNGFTTRAKFNETNVSFNDVVMDCETKLKSTKANNSFSDYNDKNFVKKIKNFSSVEKSKNKSLEREYNISLKHSALVTPQVRLPTLAEKVEERNKIFGKSKEVTVIKNIRADIKQNIEHYERMEAKANRSYRTNEKFGLFNRSKVSRSRQEKKDISGLSSRRNSDKEFHQIDSDPFNNSFYRNTSKDHNKTASGGNPRSTQGVDKDVVTSYLLSVPYQHDSDNLKTTETQNHEDLDKHSNICNSERGVTKDTHTFRSNVFHVPTGNSAKKAVRQTYNFSVSTKPQIPLRNSMITPGVAENNLADEDTANISELRSTMNSKFNVTNKSLQRDALRRAQVPIAGRRMAKLPVSPCDQIEDRLNRTFNDFMSVKTKADNSFQSALEVLKNDRPITNKIRYTKYRLDRMAFNHIDKFRKDAETCRLERYKNNEVQTKFYFEMIEYILSQELKEDKLKACFYFMDVLKELFERGENFTRENLNLILNKVDDEGSYTNVFMGVVVRVMEKLRVKLEEVENMALKNHLEKFIRVMAIKKESQGDSKS